MRCCRISAYCWIFGLLLAIGWVGLDAQQPPKSPAPEAAKLDRATVKQFVEQHCTHCHNSEDKKAGLALDVLSNEDVAAHPDAWEKVARKLSSRQMPPVGKPRPDEKTYEAIVPALEAALD